MNKKIIAILITCSALLCTILTACVPRADVPTITPNESSSENVNSSSEPKIPEKPKTESITLAAVGDNLIHDAIYMQAAARTTDGTFDFAPAYDKVSHYIKDADIAIINQETILAGEIAPLSNYPRFNSPTAVGDQLMSMGFDVITHANNHVYDMGEAGVIATLDYWDTQKDATLIGLHRDNTDKNKIDYVQRGNIKVAFLGYAESTNGLTLPKSAIVGTTMLHETDFIKSQIIEAKKNADIVVLTLHWGAENMSIPHKNQRALASDFIETGADIIIGHHSHVIQEGEFITRTDGTKGYVLYSLGNFISAQHQIKNLAGGILQMELTKDNETESTTITKINYVPTVSHYGPKVRQVTIYPFSEYSPALANNHGVHLYNAGFSYELLQKQFEPVVKSATFGKELANEN